MFGKKGFLVLGVLLIIGLSSFDISNEAHVRDWEKIGSKSVDFKLDRDVIIVGAKDGRFKKLKVAVSGGHLNMHKMMVHYGNGSKEEIKLKHNFSKSSASRVVDLNGNSRVIKKITFIYDTKNRSKRKAKIHVFGKH